jgi:hypothetical protein
MSDAAQKTPQPAREDRYFETLAAFINTSAGYLDIDARMPGQGVTRQCHARVTPVETLR